MKEIENTNTTKTNATIHKYTFQINQQQQACETDKYKNARTQAFAIDFSRRRDHEPSTLRMLFRLKMCIYRRLRQNAQKSVRIQSALCDKNRCSCEQNCE